MSFFSRFNIALLLLSVPFVAFAGSSTSNVGSTTVTKGLTSVETRFGFSEDDTGNSADKRLRMRQHIDYGFTDWYAMRVLVSQDKRRNDNVEHQTFGVENRFHLIDSKKHGWDGGFRLSYFQSDGDKTPHELEMRLVGQVKFLDGWKYRHNTVIEHDFGEDSEDGAILELRHRLVKKIEPSISYVKNIELGLDMFNDIGRLRDISGYENQDHQLGPVATINFKNKFTVQTTYRTSISGEGVDNTFGLFLKKKF